MPMTKTEIVKLKLKIRQLKVDVGDDVIINVSLGKNLKVPTLLVSAERAFPPQQISFIVPVPSVHKIDVIALSKQIKQKVLAKLNPDSIDQPAQPQVESTYDLMVVDGNNIAHVMYHTHKLSVRQQATGVKFGVLTLLYKLYAKFNPQRIVVAFDNSIPLHRFESVPEYKANRRVHPDERDQDYEAVRKQIADLKLWLTNFGVTTVDMIQQEADDLIAAYSLNYPGRRIVVSNDKDLFQLVSEDVDVYAPTKKKLLVLENFEQEAGVPLQSYVLFRSLVGDKSDGLAGVHRCGEVTARKIIKEFPTLTKLRLGYLGDKLDQKHKKLIKNSGGMRNVKSMFNCMDLSYRPPEFGIVRANEYRPNKSFCTPKKFVQELTNAGFVSMINKENTEIFKKLMEYYGE